MKTVQREKRVVLIEPVDINTPPTIPYFNMANYQHASVFIVTGNVAAAFTIAFSQAKDSVGTGAKTLEFTEIYQANNTDAIVSNRDKFSSVAIVGDAFSIAIHEASDQFMVEIDSTQLDRENHFDWVKLDVGDPGSTALVFAVAELKESNFSGQEDNPDTFPSGLV